MALYLNYNKVKIYLTDGSYRLNICSSSPFVNGIMLLSFDNYILKDSNGVYLTAKEEE